MSVHVEEMRRRLREIESVRFVGTIEEVERLGHLDTNTRLVQLEQDFVEHVGQCHEHPVVLFEAKRLAAQMFAQVDGAASKLGERVRAAGVHVLQRLEHGVGDLVGAFVGHDRTVDGDVER